MRKTFGSVVAVNDIDLTVVEGEFFSLLGPSGCGKTTLLRSIAGIYEPDAGEILLNGRNIGSLPMSARNTALVFQNYALFPHLTVFDNIAFGLKMRRRSKAEIRQRVDNVLGLVHLGGFEARYPGQLSGGQQQRVALARALVVEPELLLLDEPLSNLDAKLRETMRHEVREIQQSVGITTILVTHDIHEAFAMSDRIAVMKDGRIEQIGTPVEIYASPKTAFTAEFSGQVNRLDGQIRAVEGEVAVAETAGGLTVRLSQLNGSAEVGAAVRLMLRPERVRVGTDKAGFTNCFEATVETRTYLGSTILYKVRVSETEFLVQAANRGEAGYGTGERVFIEWNDDDVFVQQ
ncbi:ABC transporter ATP-binding protein [Oceanibacterium hippocampi]|uniref:ABC transporter ATP-binding protein n=1 Tax=Oceanibacterium hippocampi TaxID=745714 RepID=UPI0015933B7B|nr:ABC transporter ATP-binding protein [Oceanibacterium hippocampi]